MSGCCLTGKGRGYASQNLPNSTGKGRFARADSNGSDQTTTEKGKNMEYKDENWCEHVRKRGERLLTGTAGFEVWKVRGVARALRGSATPEVWCISPEGAFWNLFPGGMWTDGDIDLDLEDLLNEYAGYLPAPTENR